MTPIELASTRPFSCRGITGKLEEIAARAIRANGKRQAKAQVDLPTKAETLRGRIEVLTYLERGPRPGGKMGARLANQEERRQSFCAYLSWAVKNDLAYCTRRANSKRGIASEYDLTDKGREALKEMRARGRGN